MSTNDTSKPSLPPNMDVDFICGRGGMMVTKPGNAWVLDHIEQHLSVYWNSEKAKFKEDTKRGYWKDETSKRAVALRIINELHARGGRFMKNGPDGTYYELNDEAAIEVVQQKFRDAPKRMRVRLEKERQPKDDSPPTANNDVYSSQTNTQDNNNCLTVGLAISEGVYKTSESLKDFLLKYQVAKKECLEMLEALQSYVDVQAIKRKLEDGCYRSKEEFELDVHLTLDNAMSNNSEGTDAHKGAKAMKEKFAEITQRQTKENAGRSRKQESQGDPNKRHRESNRRPAANSNFHLKSVERQNTPIVEHPSQQPVSLGNDGAREDAENLISQLISHLTPFINEALSNNPVGSRTYNWAKDALYYKNRIMQLEAREDANCPSRSSKRIRYNSPLENNQLQIDRANQPVMTNLGKLSLLQQVCEQQEELVRGEDFMAVQSGLSMEDEENRSSMDNSGLIRPSTMPHVNRNLCTRRTTTVMNPSHGRWLSWNN